MIQECENLKGCGFIKKYEATNALACKGFIGQYCKGDKMAQCKRKAYKKEHGIAPSDDMMPNGQMILIQENI